MNQTKSNPFVTCQWNILTALTILFLQFALASASLAQIMLPYQTGFNTTAEQDQWTQYRIGDTSLMFNRWEFSTIGDPSLTHGYPVGGTEITNDWIVSEEFDFSAGAAIDSIRFKGAGFGFPFGIDTIALYVIAGNQNPDVATKQILLKLFTDSTYSNANIWRSFYGITVPVVDGPAYLAFRYQTIVNWLDVDIDDLAVSSGISGISKNNNASTLHVHPNPTQDKLFFNKTNEIRQVVLFDSQGRKIHTEVFTGNYIDVSIFNAGVYFIQVETQSGLFVNRFVKL